MVMLQLYSSEMFCNNEEFQILCLFNNLTFFYPVWLFLVMVSLFFSRDVWQPLTALVPRLAQNSMFYGSSSQWSNVFKLWFE